MRVQNKGKIQMQQQWANIKTEANVRKWHHKQLKNIEVIIQNSEIISRKNNHKQKKISSEFKSGNQKEKVKGYTWKHKQKTENWKR